MSTTPKCYVTIGENYRDYAIKKLKPDSALLATFPECETHETFDIAKIVLLKKLDKEQSLINQTIKNIEDAREADYFNS